MNTLSPDGEKALVTAIENSIRLTHDGLSPNDAITKVAQDNQFGPELIRRMAETFNKTLSVHKFKTAGVDDDRAQVFDLADAGVIIQNIYEPSEKIASAFSLPAGDFSADVLSAPVMEKTARAVDPGTVERLTAQAHIEQGHIRKGIRDQLRLESRKYKLAFDTSLDDLCEHCAPLSPRAFQKTAQFIVNGYPATGPNLLAIVVSRTTHELGDMEKTANAVVFPRLEPYLTVSRIYDAAEKMAASELAQQAFDKEGEGFFSSLAANTLANLSDAPLSKSIGTAGSDGLKKKYKTIEDDLSPEHFNLMKSHDVKRTFTLLALYDDELKQYEFPELIRAYNDAVQINPYAYRNPTILKNLMIKNLQSVGVKDPYEIKTELDIAKIQGERERQHREDIDKDKERRALLEAKAVMEAQSTLPEWDVKGESWKGTKGVAGAYLASQKKVRETIENIKARGMDAKTKELMETILKHAPKDGLQGIGQAGVRAAAEDYLRNGVDGMGDINRGVLAKLQFLPGLLKDEDDDTSSTTSPRRVRTGTPSVRGTPPGRGGGQAASDAFDEHFSIPPTDVSGSEAAQADTDSADWLTQK
jgi:hypothetical protein